MSHRYRSEPIEVVEGQDGAPAAFRWRGRRYAVRAVMAHWVEALPWWNGDLRVDRSGPASGQGHVQRHVWRVEAAPRIGPTEGSAGVYDLHRTPRGDRPHWGMARVLD